MLYEITLNKKKLNEYQLGRINGMIHILTGQPEKGYALRENDDICKMVFETDADGMFNIQDAINKVYPGVIVSEDD